MEDTWDTLIQELQTKHILDIKKVDHGLADQSEAIILNVNEARLYDKNGFRGFVKESHIIRDFSDNHNMWLYRIKQIQEEKPIEQLQQIDTAIQKVNKLIEKFYDTFVRTKAML